MFNEYMKSGEQMCRCSSSCKNMRPPIEQQEGEFFEVAASFGLLEILHLLSQFEYAKITELEFSLPDALSLRLLCLNKYHT
jgi:hypothetical protein